VGLGEVLVVVLVGIVVAAALCWIIVSIAVKHAGATRDAARRRGKSNRHDGS
jgi:hypothetical protein